jgi:hypothetical protein
MDFLEMLLFIPGILQELHPILYYEERFPSFQEILRMSKSLVLPEIVSCIAGNFDRLSNSQ